MAEIQAERIATAAALDEERRQRTALAAELRAAQEELRVRAERIETLIADNGALRRSLQLVQGGGNDAA